MAINKYVLGGKTAVCNMSHGWLNQCNMKYILRSNNVAAGYNVYRIAGNFHWVKFSLSASKKLFLWFYFHLSNRAHVRDRDYISNNHRAHLRDRGYFSNHNRAHLHDRGYFSNHHWAHLRDRSYFSNNHSAHLHERGYFSNYHHTGSNTREVTADFSWPYFRFGALHNEIKTLPAIRYLLHTVSITASLVRLRLEA